MLAAGPLASAGCAAGDNAATLQVKPDNPGGDLGPVAVRSVMLLVPPDSGEAATVVTIINKSDETQTLDSLQIEPPANGSGSPIDVAAGIRVPPSGAVNIGAAGQPTLPVTGLEQLAEPGTVVPITLVFDKAGQLTLQVLVREATGPYASFLPSPSATPTATPSPADTASPSPSPSASPTPTS